MMKIVSVILKLILETFKYFTSKHYRKQKKEEKIEKEKKKLREAVKKGDEKRVNKAINKILSLVFICFILLFSNGCILSSGDESDVVYIPEEDRIVKMEHDEKSGWWVPDAIMIKLLEKAKEEKNVEE